MTEFTPKAKWIGTGEGWWKTGMMSPATELRRVFTLDEAPKNAECLILGLGAYVLYVNGRQVGDDVLSPAYTAYDKRALYVRYDLTDFLHTGDNVIAVRLGNSFYNQTVRDEWNYYLASWRNLPRMLFELFIEGESVLVSDKSWRVRTNGAVIHNAVRTGEFYDARLEDGWKTLEYCDTGWDCAVTVNSPGGIIEEMTMPPMRECETLTTQKITKSKNGYIYDFGKNIAGYVGLKMSGAAGSMIKLTYGEQLTDGEIDNTYTNHNNVFEGEFATDKYTFRGEGIEEWHPQFVFHGFRYVELCGVESEPSPDALTAYFVHTDLRRKGSFECSDELMSWIYDAGIRSFLSNYQGISLDCPHREKNGWTGDAVISADYAVCLFDMKEAYEKWMRDMTDAQRINGQLPGIVPSCGWGYNWGSGPAWDFVIFALPYAHYLETGDDKMLTYIYTTAAKYLEYAETHEDDDGLVCFGLSDWCPPSRVGDVNKMPNRFSDSCYYYAMHKIAAVMAERSNDSTRVAFYNEKAAEIRENIRREYYVGKDLSTLGQGALSFLICYNMVTESEGADVARALVELLKRDNYVHKVGILGMKALPHALSRYGYTEVAYKTLMRYDYPSYGYWKNCGETTLCEAWEEKITSRNHHMYADVVNWMFRSVAGLRNCGIAYDKVEFSPYLFADECSASAKTETPRGDISISWWRTGSVFAADIVVPEGCDATLTLCGKTYPAKTGRVEIELNN